MLKQHQTGWAGIGQGARREDPADRPGIVGTAKRSPSSQVPCSSLVTKGGLFGFDVVLEVPAIIGLMSATLTGGCFGGPGSGLSEPAGSPTALSVQYGEDWSRSSLCWSGSQSLRSSWPSWTSPHSTDGWRGRKIPPMR